MAVAKKRKIDAYQFLYCDDTLDEGEWDIRTLADDRTYILKECLQIALKIAKEI